MIKTYIIKFFEINKSNWNDVKLNNDATCFQEIFYHYLSMDAVIFAEEENDLTFLLVVMIMAFVYILSPTTEPTARRSNNRTNDQSDDDEDEQGHNNSPNKIPEAHFKNNFF